MMNNRDPKFLSLINVFLVNNLESIWSVILRCTISLFGPCRSSASSLKNMRIFGVRGPEIFHLQSGEKWRSRGFFPLVAMVKHVICLQFIQLFRSPCGVNETIFSLFLFWDHKLGQIWAMFWISIYFNRSETAPWEWQLTLFNLTIVSPLKTIPFVVNCLRWSIRKPF